MLALRLDAGLVAVAPSPLLAAGAATSTALVVPAGLYGSGRELMLSYALTASVAVVLCATIIFARPLTHIGALVLVIGAAGVAMVLSATSLYVASPVTSCTEVGGPA